MLARFIKPFLIIAILYLPLNSFAWGMIGHRIVGEIAQCHISAKTKAAIKSILGNESIAMASNWADFIKSDTQYNYIDSWHYINFPAGLNYNQVMDYLQKDTKTDAYTRLNFLAEELKKPSLSKDKKRMYLRLLIHIAEDLSQPLHVSQEGTSGGNDIKVSWFSQNANLHSVWDTHLIEYQKLSYTEYATFLNHPSAAQKKMYMNQRLKDWLFDSYTIAQRLHDEVPKGDNVRLGYVYNYQYYDLLNEQLLKGGLRLAGLLNRIYDK